MDKDRHLRDHGWSTYYNDNYWVHPKTVKNAEVQDYTNYGLTLDEAYEFETQNKEPFPSLAEQIGKAIGIV